MPHNLAICALVKNEARYLLEWFIFHRMAGVEHFYIYEGGSTDNTKEVLQKLVSTGHVTVDYEMNKVMLGGQMRCFDDFIKKHSKDCRWVAFTDIDEFLYTPGNNQPLWKFLDEFSAAPVISGIAVHWLMFGSSGELNYKPELVTRRFTQRATLPDKHIKSVMRIRQFQPGSMCAGKDPHVFRALGMIIDENYVRMPKEYANTTVGTCNKIAIAHYHTKSKAEYFERKKFIKRYAEIVEGFAAHDRNETFDDSVIRYCPDLKYLVESF